MTDETMDSDETDFGPIKKRLKSVRSRMLLALAENDESETGEGEASVTHLRDEDGAGVPSGSLDHHLAWLRGERRTGDDLPWWPEGVGPLAVEVGREDMGYGTPTKIIGLTEDGEAVVDELRGDMGSLGAPAPGESHRGAESGSESGELSEIQERLDEMQSAIAANSERATDYGSTAEENQRRIEELEEKIEETQETVHTILDYIESSDRNVGVHNPPRNG